MNIIQYQIFVKTVECGSFTKAAKLLHLTQSGVSHAIKALETDLGLSLLNRGRGGISLTADGEMILPVFKEICASQHKLEERVKDLKSLQTGIVRIGTFSSVSIWWLPFIMKEFRRKWPEIGFEILQGDYDEIETWLKEGRVDIGFLRLPPSQDFEYDLLYRDRLVAIFPEGHPLEDKKTVSANALTKYPFILQEEGDDYEIDAVFDALDIEPQVQYTARDDQSIMAMVENGLGISILAELVVKNTTFKIKSRPLTKPFVRDIGICVLDKDALSVATTMFIDHVKRWVKENEG